MLNEPPDRFWLGQPVLVTGGSGVVGSAVVRHLVEAGAAVAGLARTEESAASLEGLGALPVFGDVLSEGSLHAACSDRRYVFHVAGINELCSPDPNRVWRVNVEGTRNTLRAAQAAGVERLVLTSSVAAVGNPTGRPADEADQHGGQFTSWYAETKWAGERVALAEAGSTEVVVVNPASVQGPGRATGTGKLILDVINRRIPFLVDTSISVVDIDDCAAGHLNAGRRGEPGERYILSGFTLTTRDAVSLLEELVGRSLKVRFVRRGLAGLLGPVVAPLIRVKGGPPLCREALRTLSTRHEYDGSRATRDLGLEYRSARETMDRFIGWAVAEGLIDVPPEAP